MLSNNKTRKIIPIFSVMLFSSYLISCASITCLLSVGDEVKEIYSIYQKEQIISLDHCVIISDAQNLVAHTNDSKVISDIKYFDKVGFNSEIFMSNYSIGDIDNLISLVGTPSFIGLESENSIDYLDGMNNIYRLYLNYNEGEYMGYKVEILDKDNRKSWLDSKKLNLPNEKDLDNIKLGMTLDEVVKLIGKPQRDIGSGGWVLEFDLSNGKTFSAVFNYDYDKDILMNNTESEQHNLYLYEFNVIVNTN